MIAFGQSVSNRSSLGLTYRMVVLGDLTVVTAKVVDERLHVSAALRGEFLSADIFRNLLFELACSRLSFIENISVFS